MTDLGKLSWCLGIQVAQAKEAMTLDQRTSIIKMLECFGILECKPVKIPAAANFKRDCFSAGDRWTGDDTRLYQLNWIAEARHDRLKTRPRVHHRKTLQVRLQALQATFHRSQESSSLSAVHQRLPPQEHSRNSWRHSGTLRVLQCFLGMSRRWSFHVWIHFHVEL